MRRKFYDRVYLYLALGLILVFWGFSKSYFGKLGTTDSAHHIHGISATLWMIILIIQPYLYKINKFKAHRYLGWFTLILVPTLVYGGVLMIQNMIRVQEFYPPNTVYQLAFIDSVTLIGFVVLYALALYYRKNLKLHARFMVCTIFGPLNPALGRIFFMVGAASNFTETLTYSYILLELVLLFIIFRERKAKEMRYTYLPVFVFTALQHALIYSANDWPWWQDMMNNFANFN